MFTDRVVVFMYVCRFCLSDRFCFSVWILVFVELRVYFFFIYNIFY